MAHRGAHGGLDELLPRFLEGDPVARDQFPRVAAPLLAHLARRYGSFLPVDVREDIVQQAHELLLTGRSVKFDPSRAGASTYLRLVVRDATRQVAAMYCRPGSTTRPPVRGEGEERAAAPPVLPIHELPETLQPVVIGMEHEVDCRCDVEVVLDAAPHLVEVALERHYFDEVSWGDIAADLGIDRFQLRREIGRFAATFAA